MLSQDSFYRGLTESELANVSDYDFDSPKALDQDAIVKCLKDLKVCSLTFCCSLYCELPLTRPFWQ